MEVRVRADGRLLSMLRIALRDPVLSLLEIKR